MLIRVATAGDRTFEGWAEDSGNIWRLSEAPWRRVRALRGLTKSEVVVEPTSTTKKSDCRYCRKGTKRWWEAVSIDEWMDEKGSRRPSPLTEWGNWGRATHLSLF